MATQNTTQRELSMLARLILFFVHETKGYMSKIELVKFLYLADLYSVKWRNEQITDLVWKRYKHGPWEEQIYAELDALRLKGYIETEEQGNATMLKPLDGFDLDGLDLPLSMRLMLENIHRGWAGYQTESRARLLEFVYQTAPMQKADEEGVDPLSLTPLDLKAERRRLLEELDELTQSLNEPRDEIQ